MAPANWKTAILPDWALVLVVEHTKITNNANLNVL